MKLTVDMVRRLIKEELQKIHEEDDEITPEKVFAILDSSWGQGMLVATALEEQDKLKLMEMAGDYAMNKIQDLEKMLNANHRRRKTGIHFKTKDVTSDDPKYQKQIQVNLYESFFQDDYDKSYIKLRKEDGMFDIDLCRDPSLKFPDYMDFNIERYQEEDLDLDQVIEKVIMVYTYGGSTLK